MNRPEPRDGYSADVAAAYEAEFANAELQEINAELQEVANEADYAENYDGEDGDYAGYDEFCDRLDEDWAEDMDGDHDSAMASAGFGTDEDYGDYGDFGNCDY